MQSSTSYLTNYSPFYIKAGNVDVLCRNDRSQPQFIPFVSCLFLRRDCVGGKSDLVISEAGMLLPLRRLRLVGHLSSIGLMARMMICTTVIGRESFRNGPLTVKCVDNIGTPLEKRLLFCPKN